MSLRNLRSLFRKPVSTFGGRALACRTRHTDCFKTPGEQHDRGKTAKGGMSEAWRQPMDQLAKCAVLSTACDAAFVAVAAAILMYAFSYDPALALKLGAFIALLFCLSMIYRLAALQKQGVRQTDIWRSLQPHELPYGAHALSQAQNRMEKMFLRFAKGASGISATLFGLALLVSLN